MDPKDQRAADADRERVAERLRAAFNEGRLDLVEFDDRIAQAYAARTYRDLDGLLADLPDAKPAGGVRVGTAAGGEMSRRVGAAAPPQRRRAGDIRRIWSGVGGGAIVVLGLWGLLWLNSGEQPGSWPVWILGFWLIYALGSTWSKLTRD